MRKIDLHIHTISSSSDRPFNFDLDTLRTYVEKRQIDAIAITNHNLFDREQFVQIDDALPIMVFPGIEIDLEGGQVLLIADGTNLHDFADRCQRVTELAPTKKESISVDVLKDIFGNLSQYIVIPHYDKKPPVEQRTLESLGSCVTAGEVTSPKKFVYCIRNPEKLVPVYFSDSRIERGQTDFSLRQTYIDCENPAFAAVKSCLRDKAKVTLSQDEGNALFQVFDDGQQLSTGLNVIIGERSSGKSHTLKRIQESMEGTRHIEQFSLVARDEEEDQRRFDQILHQRHSLLSKEFLDELQEVVVDVLEVDIEDDSRRLQEYVQSLVKHAKESERHDAFSRAKLFGAEDFLLHSQEGLEELIRSTTNLIESAEFRALIAKHVSIDALRSLLVSFIHEYCARDEAERKKKWLNELIAEVKRQLRIRTAATTIGDIDLYKIAMNKVRVQRFEEVVRLARRDREIERRDLQGFSIVASASPFVGAGELKKLSKTRSAFSQAYDVYTHPYSYLQELRKISQVEEADYHRYFVRISFRVLNRDGFEASGGERSEFNLLQELQDAQKFEMLLIDEPESSFDNIFLNESVNQLIKEIANNMPVVVVTHNSTVGASIRPDYLLCTRKEVEDGAVVYRTYSGFPSSKRLDSTDGKSISTWDVTIGCLEAGARAYYERRDAYEDIKD